jgi:hypothetical protein
MRVLSSCTRVEPWSESLNGIDARCLISASFVLAVGEVFPALEVLMSVS